jgi:hypothetical protein
MEGPLMRRLALALALAALPALAADPRDVTSPRMAEVLSGVICSPEVVETQPAPDTIAGVSNVIAEDPPFVSEGRRVPAVIGVGFAVKARTVREDLFGLTVIVTHPPMGPEGVTRQSFVTDIGSADLSLIAWQFEYNYELVTGPWTISVSDGTEKLYTVGFDVVPPDMVPELAATCGFEALLS